MPNILNAIGRAFSSPATPASAVDGKRHAEHLSRHTVYVLQDKRRTGNIRKHADPDKGLAESKTYKCPVAKQVPKCGQNRDKNKTPGPCQHDKQS